MPESADIIYKDAATIVAEIAAAWQARIPDIQLGPDSIARIWAEVFGNTVEGLMLMAQLLHDDMFIHTMNALALQRSGEMYGRPQKAGTIATGTLRFSGAGGTYIVQGTTVAAPRPSIDDALIFATSVDGTIPNPGVPDAPVATLAANAAGLADGTYEYAVTFLTIGGETEVGASSGAIITSAGNRQINLTAIPLGGPGTASRNIYRRVGGGAWSLVHLLADNVTVVWNDTGAAAGAAPPLSSTAERITLAASATDVGADYNVAIGAITDLQTVESGLSEVTNQVPFTAGSDPEDIEAFRIALLKRVRSPQSGSVPDLESWATDIDGVDSATAFKNQNLAGVATPGTVAVRISGPEGSIPSGGTVAAVQAYLDARDLANITIQVGTFAAHNIDVTVDVTTSTGYLLADVTNQVVAAITDYINSLPVGATVYKAGIIDAIFGLSGIENVTVSVPAADTAVAATEKPVPHTIVVT